MLTRLAVGLEPLNALDAAHRSPRSAPPSRTEFGSPVGSATRQSIKRNKELAKHLIGESASQAGDRSRPNCEVDQLRFPNQNRSPYGLQLSLYSLDIGYRSCCRRHRETVDAGKRSRRLHHYDSAGHRRRVRCQLSRPGTRLVSARTTSRLHRIGRRRDDPVALVSIPLSPRRLSTQRV